MPDRRKSLDEQLDETEHELGIGRHARTPETTEGQVLELIVGLLDQHLTDYHEVTGRHGVRRQVKVTAVPREPDDPEGAVRVKIAERGPDGYWDDPKVWAVGIAVERHDG